jgi:uncharacterized protein (TIGR02118 family)
MFKVLAFLSKKDGVDLKDFIDYYENKHVPLVCSLMAMPSVYKRRYIVRDEELTKKGGQVDFDVVTELGFSDRAEFLVWMAQLSGLGIGDQIAADEAKFLAPSQNRAYVVEEHVTIG